MERHLKRRWRPGEHVTLIGPAGAGKTHAALVLADLCRYILVLATKRRDPLMDGLRAKGYVQLDDLRALPMANGVPIHRRVVYWPAAGKAPQQAERLKQQAAAHRAAFAFAERQGGWAVLIDEGLWMSKNLRLDKEMEALWFQGRTSKVSVITCAQRPRHLPVLALSQADMLMIWRVSDRQEIERLREISGGIDLHLIEEMIQQLDYQSHEFLFIDLRRSLVAKSRMPA